jgi:purine nucleosidase
MNKYTFLFIVILLAVVISTSVSAFTLAEKVVVANNLIAIARVPAGGLSPVDRINAINDRLAYIIGFERLSPDNIYAVRAPGGSTFIMVGNSLLITVTPTDAQANGTTVDGLAQVWLNNFREILPEARPTPFKGGPMNSTNLSKDALTQQSKSMDVVIDTDIGTDVDDAYAILFALSSPELNVKGITLVHANLDVRAKILAKLLKLLGRTDIPFFLGERVPLKSDRPITWLGHEGRGLDFSDVEDLSPRPEHAVEFIARLATERPGELTLITIGPMTNAGMLVRDYPRAAACLRGIVSMASTFQGFGKENAGREHNAAVDPEAMDLVLRSGIPLLIVGFNVTQQTWLTGDRLKDISACRNQLSAYMEHMTKEWFGVVGRDATNMHDPLAVAACFDPSVVETIPVTAQMDLVSGMVTYHSAEHGSHIMICTGVNLDKFHKLFYDRIMKTITGSAN